MVDTAVAHPAMSLIATHKPKNKSLDSISPVRLKKEQYTVEQAFFVSVKETITYSK